MSKASRKEKEAEEGFETLLSELITSTRQHWKEARSILRKDDRYNACADVLSSDERESLWEQHVESLESSLVLRLTEGLSGMDDVTYAADWEQVWIRVKDLDHRFADLRSKTRDRAWDKWAASARAKSWADLEAAINDNIPEEVYGLDCDNKGALPTSLDSLRQWTRLASAPQKEREVLFWEVVESLQKKKKDERRKLEQSLGDNKRSRTK